MSNQVKKEYHYEELLFKLLASTEKRANNK
jgi:hypothetical protein